MSADNWTFYHEALLAIGRIGINLNGGDGSFAFVLLDNTYVPDRENHQLYSDISAFELPELNGYFTGGMGAAGHSWTRNAGISKIDFSDSNWTANGGPLAAQYCALVFIIAGSGLPQPADKLVAYTLMDQDGGGLPVEVIATDGADLIVRVGADGNGLALLQASP